MKKAATCLKEVKKGLSHAIIFERNVKIHMKKNVVRTKGKWRTEYSRLEYELYLQCVDKLEIVRNPRFLILMLNFKFNSKEHNSFPYYSTAKSEHLK